ncbi:MAG: PilZ domain-containing protein [Desulfobacterales bacterium]|nr:PilZ domain-containing protein [Desulfobacterales bacterium]
MQRSQPAFIQKALIGTEMIQGKIRFDIFEQLRKDKTLIQMHLLGTDYVQLTIVTEIRARKNMLFFLIDYPKGFKEAVSDIEVWGMRFEFIGSDNLQYVFKTSGGEISGNEIWIRFPESIEKTQRREHFRIEVPLGAKLHFKKKSAKFEMNIIDISLKGALVTSIQKHAILKFGEDLIDVQLVFPSEKEDLMLNIKKVSVKRAAKNPRMERYTYGLYFAIIEKQEETALTKIIYELQRKLLQKRRRIYD